VYSAGEKEEALVADGYRDEYPAVADDLGNSEPRDVLIGDRDRVFELVCIVAQARSEHDGGVVIVDAGSCRDNNGCGMECVYWVCRHRISPSIKSIDGTASWLISPAISSISSVS
jgi:hypothetical protein